MERDRERGVATLWVVYHVHSAVLWTKALLASVGMLEAAGVEEVSRCWQARHFFGSVGLGGTSSHVGIVQADHFGERLNHAQQRESWPQGEAICRVPQGALSGSNHRALVAVGHGGFINLEPSDAESSRGKPSDTTGGLVSEKP